MDAVALNESEKRFRRLFREAPMAMCFVGEDGTMLALNDRFVRLFGYTREDLPTSRDSVVAVRLSRPRLPYPS